MSYEQSCNEYALFGDPMREAYEYEEAARYDRWDGHRMDMGGIDTYDPEDYPAPTCLDEWGFELWLELQAEETHDYHWADLVAPEVPF